MVAIAYEPDYLCLTSFCSGPEFLVSPSWGSRGEDQKGLGSLSCRRHLAKTATSSLNLRVGLSYPHFLDEVSLTREHIVSKDSALELNSF